MKNAAELGASLYVPASRPDVVQIARGEKLPHVRSIIFCTEDGIHAADLPAALENLRQALPVMNRGHGRIRFVRVRNPSVLDELLRMPGVEHLDGFVLPKIQHDVLCDYTRLLDGHNQYIMPTLETREVFEPSEMRALRRLIEAPQIRDRILTLRIGGNDLLSLLGMRRPRGKTIYQTPIGPAISSLVTIFKPSGFNLSGPVFEYFDDPETLVREVCEDLDHGLVGKTAAHPDQISLIESCYRVTSFEHEMAERILSGTAPAVFRMHGSMCEAATHSNWAHQVRISSSCFGIRELGAAEVDSLVCTAQVGSTREAFAGSSCRAPTDSHFLQAKK